MILKKWEKLPPELQTEEVRRYYDILKKKNASLLFIVVKLVERFDGLLFTLLILGFKVILHSISAIGVFILLQRFVNRFLQNSKVINFFAKHSMVIYLVHQQLIYFSIGWFNTLVPPVVLVLINFAFAMIISTIFSVLMSMTKVTRFLVGSK